jgi:hypothetical protein
VSWPASHAVWRVLTCQSRIKIVGSLRGQMFVAKERRCARWTENSLERDAGTGFACFDWTAPSIHFPEAHLIVSSSCAHSFISSRFAVLRLAPTSSQSSGNGGLWMNHLANHYSLWTMTYAGAFTPDHPVSASWVAEVSMAPSAWRLASCVISSTLNTEDKLTSPAVLDCLV